MDQQKQAWQLYLGVMIGITVILLLLAFIFGQPYNTDKADTRREFIIEQNAIHAKRATDAATKQNNSSNHYWGQDRVIQNQDYQVTNEDDGCNIKGNISYTTGEKIYHLPGQQYYEQTTINLADGERWFCSEVEAQAAGWRKSKL